MCFDYFFIRSYQPNTRKTSGQEADGNEAGLVASTELASELKMAFAQYAKVRLLIWHFSNFKDHCFSILNEINKKYITF